jgi:hypothetical protein
MVLAANCASRELSEAARSDAENTKKRTGSRPFGPLSSSETPVIVTSCPTPAHGPAEIASGAARSEQRLLLF